MLRLLTFGGLSLESGDAAAAPRLKPQRLALLAVLAAAGERGVTRERLVGLFWPEADDERGRHSLRQMLYALRQEAGADLVEAGSSLFLNGGAIGSDLGEVRAAIVAGDRRRVAALYRGPFLDGFYLTGSPEFERWVEQERQRHAETATTTLLALANEDSAAGRHDDAVGWWQRLTLLDPLSSRFALGYARALAAQGERPKALAFIASHEALVRRELEVIPDPELARLATALRAARAGDAPAPAAEPPKVDTPAATPARRAPAIAQQPGPSFRPRLLGGMVAAALAVILGALGVRRILAERHASGSGVSAFDRPYTRSAVAARFYQEGLRAWYADDPAATRRLMQAALREDSTFAMAAYLASVAGDQPELESRQRALRLAERAPEHDRLTIQAEVLTSFHEPDALAIAEQAAGEYPDDPNILMALGKARITAGDWAGAAEAFERVIALNLPPGGTGGEGCPVCKAFDRLTEVYEWWDSIPAVERVARRYLEVAPANIWPYGVLAAAAARRGDSAAALTHLRRFAAAPVSPLPRNQELVVLLLLEQYDRVLETAGPLAASAHTSESGIGKWMAIIALRNQGRLAAAEQVLRTGRLPGSPRAPDRPPSPDYFNEAILAFEGGIPRQAAAFFEILRRADVPGMAGQQARWRAWNALLQATALAEAGDTVAVRQLADTVEYWGQRTLFGRDRKAHHFLRGLLLAHREDDDGAVAEYRAAIFSPSFGYTRVNLELARALLRLGRPAEAVKTLQPALRGAVDASNLYVTRTELHELLAEAFTRLGQADSAAAHDRAVVQAWSGADARFAARRDVSRRRLAQYLAARQ